MRIGVPRETLEGERRVALVPDAVSRLVKAGVEVAVEQHGERGVLGPDVGDDHRQATDLELCRLDLARLQPALDEPGAELHAVLVRAVVGDQPLCEKTLVHAARLGADARISLRRS